MKHLQINLENRTEHFERKKIVLKIRGKLTYSKAKMGEIFPYMLLYNGQFK